MKILIQMFRDSRMITGRNSSKVATMAIKLIGKEAPRIKNETINAATAKAIPTP
tara:strand:+ start:29929 stop:30090 length:162 start_codon:yes stop_codon:yes gene_type:complete